MECKAEGKKDSKCSKAKAKWNAKLRAKKILNAAKVKVKWVTSNIKDLKYYLKDKSMEIDFEIIQAFSLYCKNYFLTGINYSHVFNFL